MRHRRGLDLRGRCPPERRRGLGELLADAQRRELFDRRGRLGGTAVAVAADAHVVFRRRQGLGRASESAAARHDGKEHLSGSTLMEGKELGMLNWKKLGAPERWAVAFFFFFFFFFVSFSKRARQKWFSLFFFSRTSKERRGDY